MDKLLQQDLTDLDRFIYQVGPSDGQEYYSITRPALEAIKHLFVTVDKQQRDIEALQAYVDSRERAEYDRYWNH